MSVAIFESVITGWKDGKLWTGGHDMHRLTTESSIAQRSRRKNIKRRHGAWLTHLDSHDSPSDPVHNLANLPVCARTEVLPSFQIMVCDLVLFAFQNQFPKPARRPRRRWGMYTVFWLGFCDDREPGGASLAVASHLLRLALGHCRRLRHFHDVGALDKTLPTARRPVR